jgi:23S rRNA pseudouridine1911/1915/1917 synthase
MIIAEAATRLDSFLATILPDLSRSRLQSLIKEGQITVNGTAAKPSMELIGGEEIYLKIPEPEELQLIAEDLPLAIVYEDADIIVIDKPQGMVVHPAAGHDKGTLVNALLHHCKDLSGINGVIRPGIVHRIDKDTSGLLVAAKNDAAHTALSERWQEHDIKREYLAILHGVVAENAGIIDAPIGRHTRQRQKMAVLPDKGRHAVTNYYVLERFKTYTYAKMELDTGRTHQIRVHMSHLGYPVAGDPLYGPRKNPLNVAGQLLHAATLGFNHPRTGEYVEFKSEPPAYFQEVLDKLRSL